MGLVTGGCWWLLVVVGGCWWLLVVVGCWLVVGGVSGCACMCVVVERAGDAPHVCVQDTDVL